MNKIETCPHCGGEVKETIVDVCVVERTQPFICAVYGSMNGRLWDELEEEIQGSDCALLKGLPRNTVTARCRIESFEGQYNELGRCEVAPYNMLVEVDPPRRTYYDSVTDMITSEPTS